MSSDFFLFSYIFPLPLELVVNLWWKTNFTHLYQIYQKKGECDFEYYLSLKIDSIMFPIEHACSLWFESPAELFSHFYSGKIGKRTIVREEACGRFGVIFSFCSELDNSRRKVLNRNRYYSWRRFSFLFNWKKKNTKLWIRESFLYVCDGVMHASWIHPFTVIIADSSFSKKNDLRKIHVKKKKKINEKDIINM